MSNQKTPDLAPCNCNDCRERLNVLAENLSNQREAILDAVKLVRNNAGCIDAHAVRLGGHSERLGRLNDRVGECETTLTNHEDTIDAHGGHIVHLDTRVSECEATVSDHDGAIAEHGEKLVTLENRFIIATNRLDNHRDRFNEVDKRVGDFKTYVSENECAVAEHAARLNKLENYTALLNSRFDYQLDHLTKLGKQHTLIEARQNAQATSLEALEHHKDRLHEARLKQQDEIDHLATHVNLRDCPRWDDSSELQRLEQKIEDQAAKITRLQEQQTMWGGLFTKQGNLLEALDARIANLAGALNGTIVPNQKQHEKNLFDLTETVDQINERLSTFGDYISDHSDQLERFNEATIEPRPAAAAAAAPATDGSLQSLAERLFEASRVGSDFFPDWDDLAPASRLVWIEVARAAYEAIAPAAGVTPIPAEKNPDFRSEWVADDEYLHRIVGALHENFRDTPVVTVDEIIRVLQQRGHVIVA